MSKRPINKVKMTPPPKRDGVISPKNKLDWENRVYQNSFTRGGQKKVVSTWSVKIQSQGKRRAFSLQSSERKEAAIEARTLFETILELGWEAATRDFTARKNRLKNESRVNHKYTPEFWRPRLITRRYLELARADGRQELSVRIDHGGLFHYFPLRSTEEETAANRAAEINKTVMGGGWGSALRKHERELTIAIFWAGSPLACTYTTYFSIPCPDRFHRPPAREGPFNVWVIEHEQEVGDAICFWINRQRNFRSAGYFRQSEEALRKVLSERPAMLLVNRDFPSAFATIEKFKILAPDLPIFPYGVFDESDQIFMSFVGVKAGYILQRREPDHWFEPFENVNPKQPLSAALAQRHIRQHFQNLFKDHAGQDDVGRLGGLTGREQVIMTYLTRGLLDKELAEILDLSYWTVHNHLKKIYQKLGVHNRTEAVVKYLHGSKLP